MPKLENNIRKTNKSFKRKKNDTYLRILNTATTKSIDNEKWFTKKYKRIKAYKFVPAIDTSFI
jgi:hypothetical protein